MKKNTSTKHNEAVSASDDKSFQAQPEKSGILKRFLDWITKGAEKVKTCPT